ncbi:MULTISPECIES: DUF3846 domain-containing protein [unclassified Planococcus (in: firmicutes)]|nr:MULTISPECIES: DUF3846 domain-containing protein [unclassified Planococcus (in: firmicutes)]
MVPIAMAAENLKSQTTICRFEILTTIRVKGATAEMRFLLFLFSKITVPIGTKGAINMTTFLMRKEMELGWTEVEIKNEKELTRVVGERLQEYELPMGLQLIYSEQAQFDGTPETFSAAIVEDDGDSQPFFKTVLLAAVGKNKSLKPLSAEQVKWLNSHSELVQTPAGQLVMKINPFLVEEIAPVKTEAQFLARQPQDPGFELVSLPSLKEKQIYVDGNIEYIELPNGIDLGVNDEFLFISSPDTLNLCLIQKSGRTQKIFGSVYFAATNEKGETTSLSAEKMKWIQDRTELVVSGEGKLFMVFDPYEIVIKPEKGAFE